MPSVSSIDRLFDEFGTSLPETRKLMAALSKQNISATTMPKQSMMPTVLSGYQAKQYGIDVPDDWTVSVLPVTDPEGNPHFKLTRPDGWTITDVGQYISPEGERLDEMQYMQHVAKEQQENQLLLAQLSGALLAGPNITPVAGRPAEYDIVQGFIDGLMTEGRTPETERMLTSVFEATPEDIDALFNIWQQEPTARTATPTGTTPLETMLATPSSLPYPASATEVERFKNYEQMALEKGLSVKGALLYGEHVAMLHELQPENRLWEAMTYFGAGTGDFMRNAAAVFAWAGNDGIAEGLREFASKGSWADRPRLVTKQGVNVLADPRWYTSEAPRILPFTLALLPLTLLGGAGAAALGLGTAGRIIVGGLLGGGASMSIESAMEGAGVYEELVARGESEEVANEKAWEVAKRNMLVLGASDPLQAMLALGWNFIPGANNPLLKFSAMLGVQALSEAGEEVMQDVFTRLALGEDVKFDYRMQEAAIAGGVMGLGFGGVAGAYGRIANQSVENMTDSDRQAYEDALADNLAAGMPNDTAQMDALNKAAETESAREAIKAATEQVKQEEYQKAAEAFDVPLTVRPTSDIIADAFASSWTKRVMQQMAKVPVIKRAIESVLGPRETVNLDSAAVEDQVSRAYILWLTVRQQGQNMAAAWKHVLQATISKPADTFGFNKMGYSQRMQDALLPEYESERGVAGTVEHVLTNPEKYTLTDAEVRYAAKLHKMYAKLLDLMKREGVEPKKLKVGGYIHRIVTGYMAVEEGDLSFIEAQGRSAPDKSRVFATMADGIAAGYTYSPNPEDGITEAAYFAYKKIADARFQQLIADFGEKPVDVLLREHPEIQQRMDLSKHALDRLNKLWGTIELVRKGGKINDAQLRVFEREFPDIGRELRRLSPKGIANQKDISEYIGYLKLRIGQMEAALAAEKEARRVAAETGVTPEHEAALRKAEQERDKAVAAAKEQAARQPETDDQKILEAFRVLDWDGRSAFRSAFASLKQSAEQVAYENGVEAERMADALSAEQVYARVFERKLKPGKATGKVTKAKARTHRGMTLLSLMRGRQFPDTITLSEAEALKGEAPSPQSLTKDGKRVVWAYFIDEIATEFGFENDQEFVNHIEAVARDVERMEDMREMAKDAKRTAESMQHMLDLMDKAEAQEPSIAQEPPTVAEPEAEYSEQVSEPTTQQGTEGEGFETARADDVRDYWGGREGQARRKMLSQSDVFVVHEGDGVVYKRVVPSNPRSNPQEVARIEMEKLGVLGEWAPRSRLEYRTDENEPVIIQEKLKMLSKAESKAWLKANGVIPQHEIEIGVAPDGTYKIVDVSEYTLKGVRELAASLPPQPITQEGTTVTEQPPDIIPQAMPGELEAGLQTDMFGYAKPYYPKGKGKLTQISLDDYNKYVNAWEQAGNPGTPPNIGVAPKMDLREPMVQVQAERAAGEESQPTIGQVSEPEPDTTFWRMEAETPAPLSEKERKAQLRALSDTVNQMRSGSKYRFVVAREARTAAMEKIRSGGLRLARVPRGKEGALMSISTQHALFGGKLYHQNFVDEVNRWFGRETGSGWLQPVCDVAAILRMAKASFDASWSGVQGMPGWGFAHSMLFVNPALGLRLMGNWYKALGYTLGVWLSPEWGSRYFAEHIDAIEERISYGGSARSIDYFQAATAQFGLGGAVAGVLHRLPGDPVNRAEMSFLIGSEVCRTGMWEAMKPSVRTGADLFNLARFLDRMGGIMDTRGAGVPVTTRRLEQAFMWFAPSYTRACLSLMAHVFRGGYTGKQAKRAIGGAITAGVTYMAAITFAKALLSGRDDDEAMAEVMEMLGVVTDPLTGEVDWHPTSKFMSFEAFGYRFGIGGFWYGMVRLAGRVIDAADHIGEDDMLDYWGIIKDGGLNRDNPFINWWYSRSSPLVGMVTDLGLSRMNGGAARTYFGYPIETPEEYAFYMLSAFTPIWMEQGLFPFLMPYVDEYLPNLSRQYDMPQGSAKVLSPLMEFLGARTNPKYPWELFYDEADASLRGMPDEWFAQWYSAEELPRVLEAQHEGTLTYRQLPKMAKQDLRGKFDAVAQAYEAATEDSAIRESDEWRSYNARVDTERAMLNQRLADANERYRMGEMTSYEWRTRVSDIYSLYGATMDAIRNEPAYGPIFEYFDKLRAQGRDDTFVLDVALAEYEAILYGDYEDPVTGEVDFDERDRRLLDFTDKWGLGVVEQFRAYHADKSAQKGTPEFNLAKSGAMAKLDEAYWDMESAQRTEYRKANPEMDAALFLYGYGGKLQTAAAYRIALDTALQFGFTDDAFTKVGLPPQHLANDYFGYVALTAESSGSSLDAKYYRLEHPAFDEWGQEAYGWKPIDAEGLMPLKVRDLMAQYDAIEGAKERLVFRHENPDLEAWMVEEKGYKPVGDRWE